MARATEPARLPKYGIERDDCRTTLSFIREYDGDFDDETTRIMGQAFDAACARLNNPNYSVCELIADRIIDTAARGERDPVRLRDAGVEALKPGLR